MTDQDQKQLGNTLWGIADQLRGAMNADDFRDYRVQSQMVSRRDLCNGFRVHGLGQIEC
jgi:type I restriction-modification system DNA methylase subunit